MELFLIDKFVIGAITALIHSPSAQFFTLLGAWAASIVLLPKSNKETDKQ